MAIASKKIFFGFFLLVGDILLMYGSLFLVLIFRYDDLSALSGPQARQFLLHFSALHIFWAALLFAFDFYELFAVRKRIVFFKNLALFSALAFGMGALYFYLNLRSLIMPKTILFFDVALVAAAVFLWRFLFDLAAGWSKFKRKIAVVGWRPEMDELARNYIFTANYEIAAVFSAGSFPGFEKTKIFSDPREFVVEVKAQKIDRIIFVGPAGRDDPARGVFAKIVLESKTSGLENFYEEITGKVPLDMIGQGWIMEKISGKDDGNYRIVKRVFDIALSLCGLAATAVIFPLIFLAIKADSPGPVFYVQKRKGRCGKEFLLYKFRTMTATADQHIVWRGNDATQVTRAGRVLKKAHIDEFPQFFNILKGDLSFAGPRPEWEKLACDYEKEIPFYRCRYFVQPGITGWAQINYRASNSLQEAREKFEYDLYYIKNRSFLLDVAIIAKTVQLFFR
jgi:exopolysaccharide biosynthesis polyprenyl glycosylphosphotransferase